SNLELNGVECPKCNWKDFRQTEKCLRCGNSVNQTIFPGLGKIHTFTVIRYPPRGFEDESPYVVALIDLDEGPRIIGRIRTKNGNVDIGATVRLVGNRGDAFDFALE
ncbi:MAG: Zn-ribbon domain-containing OB-fold protein, partial [Candidatus Bathyarchaeia archaeon]